MDSIDPYAAFLEGKRINAPSVGIPGITAAALTPSLFDFQAAVTALLLRRGRGALFGGTGTGKTRMEAEWSHRIALHTGGSTLLLTPPGVARQWIGQAAEMGIEARRVANGSEVKPGINVTNYHRLHLFDPAQFSAIAIDESSCLKGDGPVRQALHEFAASINFRLAATATPAPNDLMELGNHVEFLGIMTASEMLATYFCHDGGDTSKWRLKGHAEEAFFDWVATWAIAFLSPDDLGFDGSRYVLPKLTTYEHIVDAPMIPSTDGALFVAEAVTLTEQRAARSVSIDARVAKVAEIVATKPDEQWTIWCDLNAEGDALEKLIPGAVQVSGADSIERKEQVSEDFEKGIVRHLVSKSSIFGYGLNYQHCHNVARVGVTHSWEGVYQELRRSWRFGQKMPVDFHMVLSDAEMPILRNFRRKEIEAEDMSRKMIAQMVKTLDLGSKAETGRDEAEYVTAVENGENFTAYLGDCVEVMRGLPSEKIGYTIFSPPFPLLYTYSNSNRDMGNSRTDDEFYAQFHFAVRELYRITMPGRLLSFHCMNLPTSKAHTGVIGIKDFRGDLIRMFQAEGWIYHSEVCIWKDPVIAMQRTKALGLLHKTIEKDSAMSRQGIPDYLVTMRKPGDNPEPIAGRLTEFHGDDHSFIAGREPGDRSLSIDIWQRYASPVWMDINPSDTLSYRSVREEKDERHICALQLTVIRRGIELWSNPGDTVFSPFGGIGSEPVTALEMGRKAIVAELKPSYFKQLVANCRNADGGGAQLSMFDTLEEPK